MRQDLHELTDFYVFNMVCRLKDEGIEGGDGTMDEAERRGWIHKNGNSLFLTPNGKAICDEWAT